jgi:outer membrane protein insertion porin family/translocation and assembly module TamA
MRSRPLSAAALLAVAALESGCTSIPPGRSAIDTVKVHGAKTLGGGEVTDRLATTESPKFLGLFRGLVYDYTVYDESVLQRDLARVERYARGKGFFDAHARAARVTHLAPDHVRVDIVVDEGPPTLNREVSILGIDGLPPAIADAVRDDARVALPFGDRFDEEEYKKAQEAVRRAMTDRGYAYATLKAEARVDLGAHRVDYVFEATPGIPATFGDIEFVGLDPDGEGPQKPVIDEKQLRRTADIKPGTKYSELEVESATQALLDLQVFSSVRIEPKLSDPPSPTVPLVVKLEPAKLRLLRLGAGFQLDTIKADVHLVTGWEDRNFLGGLRDFNVDFKPGIVLYPTSLTNFTAPDTYLFEERLRVNLRQPGFIEARTVGFVQPEFNVYPLLVEPKPGQSVVGYFEPKMAIGLNRRFGKRVNATLAYNVQSEIPFRYPSTPAIDPNLQSIVLLFPQLITTLDLRDDPIKPHKGVFFSNDFQVAGVPFTSLPSDLRIQPEVRGYVPLARGVTFATRGTLGFLYAFGDNYGTDYRRDINDVDGNVQLSQDRQLSLKGLNTDIQTIYFRGFYSGGPNSNRGFPVRGASPHGVVPFLTPVTAAAQVQNCFDNVKLQVKPDCLVPIGGFTLWEASVEVRFDVAGPFGVTVFCDSGNVSPNAFDLEFQALHVSCGAGARYDTPVGPVRLDFGYRIQPLQVLGYPDANAAAAAIPSQGIQPELFGFIPGALSFGIGEAF